MMIARLFSKHNSNDGRHDIYTILGVKIKIRKSYNSLKSLNEMFCYRRAGKASPVSSIHEQMESVIHTALLHQKSFGDLKFINSGKEVVLCATGPTLDYYDPIENAVHIGLKEAFKIEKIKFNYLFHHDVTGYSNPIIPEEFTSYRGKDCIKFIGNSVQFLSNKKPEDNGVRFFNSANEIHYQIDYFPLPDYYSIAFPALAFALWTKPKRIYIVGADCSKGYAKNTNINRVSDNSLLINGWRLMKNFAVKYYPDIEIISINPVGLKGLFKDFYTEKYLSSANFSHQPAQQ